MGLFVAFVVLVRHLVLSLQAVRLLFGFGPGFESGDAFVEAGEHFRRGERLGFAALDVGDHLSQLFGALPLPGDAPPAGHGLVERGPVLGGLDLQPGFGFPVIVDSGEDRVEAPRDVWQCL
ncbi:hypothetical protein [Streptomyces sp. NPDC029674]|uniref:hypothetical protein n=1 Tax=Streptomyces sp. NPDC029674 TaxID=3365297 RepID=UPI00384D45F7